MLLAETVHAVQAQGGVSTVSARHGIECDVSSTGTYARFGELHDMHSLQARSGSTNCQAHCTTAWKVWVGVCRGLPLFSCDGV